MPGLNDMMIKVQTLSGQIKKADERIDENKALRLRAEAALQSAIAAEEDAIEGAASLRKERDDLADRVADEIRREGEPVNVEPLKIANEIFYGGDAGGSMSDGAASPVASFPNSIFNGPDEQPRAEF